MPEVIGVGYEGLDLDGFISRLRLRNVDVLVDVRLNAISRKRGFSKSALSTALSAAGIDYVHLPALGNHRDNRAGYSSIGTDEADTARERFRNELATAEASEALHQIVELRKTKLVALFCFEADEAHCHRQQVREALDEMLAPQLAAAS